MAVIREVDVTLKGQVPGDYGEKDYEVLMAELRLIAAKYGLQIINRN